MTKDNTMLTHDFLLLAHRGCSGLEEENTKPAFSLAQKTAQGVEFDVRLTKDKKPIVFHDTDFKRICGDNRRVHDTNWNDLPLTKKKSRILSLEEALLACQGLTIHMEIKDVQVLDYLPDLPKRNFVVSSFFLEAIKPLSGKHTTLFLIDKMSQISQFAESGATFLGASWFLSKNVLKKEPLLVPKTYIYTVNDQKKLFWLKKAGFLGAYSDLIHNLPIEIHTKESITKKNKEIIWPPF